MVELRAKPMSFGSQSCILKPSFFQCTFSIFSFWNVAVLNRKVKLKPVQLPFTLLLLLHLKGYADTEVMIPSTMGAREKPLHCATNSWVSFFSWHTSDLSNRRLIHKSPCLILKAQCTEEPLLPWQGPNMKARKEAAVGRSVSLKSSGRNSSKTLPNFAVNVFCTTALLAFPDDQVCTYLLLLTSCSTERHLEKENHFTAKKVTLLIQVWPVQNLPTSWIKFTSLYSPSRCAGLALQQ